MKFLIKYGLLPVLFLMGFAMSSDAFIHGFGVNLSFVIVICFVFYYLFMYKHRIRGGISYSWWIYLLIVPTFTITAVEGGSLSDMFCSTLVLMLPFALEPFVPGNDKQTIRGFYLTFVVTMLVLFMYSNMGFLSNWNPNCIAYLIFLGIAGVAVILSENRKNIVVWVFLVYAVIQLMVTQCRNVISSIVLIILIVAMKRFFSRKTPYKIITIVAVFYSAILPIIMNVVSGTVVYEYIRNILEAIFTKEGLFSGRNELFQVAEMILKSNIFKNIFGFGNPMTSVLAVHNDYYMVRYAYGIVGTVIIGMLLYKFFKDAYVLVKKGDNITFGCVAVVIGILYQQGTEGWFLGSPLVILMAFVYMAIVIKRYRMSEGKHLKNENA